MGSTAQGPDIVVAGLESTNTPPPIVAARRVDPAGSNPTARIDLLAFMWQMSTDRTDIWMALGAALFFAVFGAWIFPIGLVGTGRTRIAATAFGALCLTWSLALLYVVLVPLSMRPTNRIFLSFARLTGRDDPSRAR